jgi:hypothetical protein
MSPMEQKKTIDDENLVHDLDYPTLNGVGKSSLSE